MAPIPRLVVDTNVVFTGLTQSGGAAGIIVEAWLAGTIQCFVTNAVAYEYFDVLARKLSERRWLQLEPVLARLLECATFVDVHYRWRPSSPDPGDEHLIDCALNAGALLVTSNVRDFARAESVLGLRIMTPVDYVRWYAGL